MYYEVIVEDAYGDINTLYFYDEPGVKEYLLREKIPEGLVTIYKGQRIDVSHFLRDNK